MKYRIRWAWYRVKFFCRTVGRRQVNSIGWARCSWRQKLDRVWWPRETWWLSGVATEFWQDEEKAEAA